MRRWGSTWRARHALACAVAALTLAAAPATGQVNDQDNDENDFVPEPERPTEGFRVGLTLGSTSLVGLTFEYRHRQWAGELTVGTFSLRDLSGSLAFKRYFGERQLQPVLGLGMWGMVQSTDEGRGTALIARMPAAVDWQFVSSHALGLELALNRALHVQRLDPEDDTPPRENLVPLPGFYYRFGWER